LLLQRYIFFTIARRFVAFTLVLTGVFAVVALMQVSRHNRDVSLSLILSRIHLLPLESLGFTFPISVLFATALTFGRMTADNEILAMRTGGIHPFRFFSPAIVFGLLLSALTIWLSGTVAPAAKAKGSALTKGDLRRLFDSLETSGRTEFESDFFSLSWRGVDEEGAVLEAVFHLNVPDHQEIHGHAERLKIRQAGDRLEFHGRGIRGMSTAGSERTSAEELEQSYPVDELFGGRDADNKALMTNRELRFRVLRDPLLGRRPGARNLLQYRIEHTRRLSFSLACAVFALVGAGAGLLFRLGSFVGAALVTLGAVASFYLLHLLTHHLAYERTLAPGLAAAVPGVVLGAVGLALRVRETRR